MDVDPPKSALALLQCYSDSSEDEDNPVADMEDSNKPLATQDLPSLAPQETNIVLPLAPPDQQGPLLPENEPQVAPRVSSEQTLPEAEPSDIPAEGTIPAKDDSVAIQFLTEPYREAASSSDDDDVSCPPLPVDNEGDDDEDGQDVKGRRTATTTNFKAKMLEDLGILDLAPLEDLKITVAEEECIPIGSVHNVIDMLVIVAAKRGCPAIDLDSVLFLDHGRRLLGQVFDVFGPVGEPMYMVRFNSAQDIQEQGIQLGTEVYFAPRTRHTAYVFLDSLIQQRGSDASWENDQEPPEGCLDYSDDEEERRAKAAHRLKKKVPPGSTDPHPEGPELPGASSGGRPMARGRRRNNSHNRGGGGRGGHPRLPANPFYMMQQQQPQQHFQHQSYPRPPPRPYYGGPRYAPPPTNHPSPYSYPPPSLPPPPPPPES